MLKFVPLLLLLVGAYVSIDAEIARTKAKRMLESGTPLVATIDSIGKGKRTKSGPKKRARIVHVSFQGGEQWFEETFKVKEVRDISKDESTVPVIWDGEIPPTVIPTDMPFYHANHAPFGWALCGFGVVAFLVVAGDTKQKKAKHSLSQQA